jgi:hypothetical protein
MLLEATMNEKKRTEEFSVNGEELLVHLGTKGSLVV